jgi:hypothetical protein
LIRGERTGLRAIEKEDLPFLLEWRNRPEYRKYFREYRELSYSHQLKWYEQVVLNDPKTVMFAIVKLDDGTLIGACGLCYINWIHRNADFSIYIGADHLYIENDYAPDASKLLLAYGFDELGLHRIWSEIYDFDERKKQLFESLGFSLDGRHRQTYWWDGRWHDSLFYSLIKGEHRR